MIDAAKLQYRLRQDPRLARLREEALEMANTLLKEGLPQLTYALFRLFEETGDRDQYQRVYFRRKAGLTALAIAGWVTDEERFWKGLEEAVWDICGEFTWCLPAHLPTGQAVSPTPTVDLFAAETAQMLSELLTLSGEKLADGVRQRIRLEVEKRVFQPVFGSETPLYWETVDHNWASVCAGSVGMAALDLVEDNERLPGMLGRMKEAMDNFLSGYGEDGGCAEGIGYWEYGFGYYVYFADKLRDYTRGEQDLLADAKVRSIASFPGKVHLSAGVYANYSDSLERTRVHPGLLAYLDHKFGGSLMTLGDGRQLGLHDDPCYRWAPLIRNIAWLKDMDVETAVVQKEPAAVQKGFMHLSHLNWFMDCRLAAGRPVAFSTKAGHNAEPHNHNDLGHFILHVDGFNVLCDLGSGQYTRDYFGPKRYSILNNSSAGHSVPVLNGSLQAVGGERKAVLLAAWERADGCFVSMELSEAYPAEAGIKAFTRSFTWEQEGEQSYLLTVEDRFLFEEGAGQVEERFVSRIRPEIPMEGAVKWVLPEGSAEVVLQYDGGRFKVDMDAVDLIDHGGQQDRVYLTKLQRLEQEQKQKQDAEAVERFKFIVKTKP